MALAFCCPVNIEQFTDYLELVERPMDLQTVDMKLQENVYTCLEEYCVDMRLIWQNCKAYNSRGSEIYDIASRLGTYFEELLTGWLLEPIRGEVSSTGHKGKSRAGRTKVSKTLPQKWAFLSPKLLLR